jgi:hypothetical protein
MPLFVDGSPSSVEDLTNQDSGLLDVCRTEQIDVSVKLKLAQDEIAAQLDELFEGQRSIYSPYYGQPRLNIHHLAVTPSLKMWHTWHALGLVYRDAYFGQLNDRFQAKWNEYRKLAGEAKRRLREVGVGLVLDPLPRPGGPTLTLTPATEIGGTFYFSISVLNAAGEESASAATVALSVPDGNAVDMQISSQRQNVGGWNAYAGNSPESLHLQNSSPLGVGEDWVFYPSTALQNGQTPCDGQKPHLVRSLPRLIQRG